MRGMAVTVNPSVQDAQTCAPSSRRAVESSRTFTYSWLTDIAAAVSVFFFLISASALCGLILLGFLLLALSLIRISLCASERKKQPIA